MCTVFLYAYAFFLIILRSVITYDLIIFEIKLCIYKSVVQRDRNLNYECSLTTKPIVMSIISISFLLLPTYLT